MALATTMTTTPGRSTRLRCCGRCAGLTIGSTASASPRRSRMWARASAVRSQIARIIEHLLKLEYSPAADPRFDWMASIVEARRALADKITATLQRDAEAMLPELYSAARALAASGLRKCGEHATAARLPPICPYTLEQIRARGWYPKTP